MSDLRPPRSALLRVLQDRARAALSARVEALRAAAEMDAVREDARAPEVATAADGLSAFIERFPAPHKRRRR